MNREEFDALPPGKKGLLIENYLVNLKLIRRWPAAPGIADVRILDPDAVALVMDEPDFLERVAKAQG